VLLRTACVPLVAGPFCGGGTASVKRCRPGPGKAGCPRGSLQPEYLHKPGRIRLRTRRAWMLRCGGAAGFTLATVGARLWHAGGVGFPSRASRHVTRHQQGRTHRIITSRVMTACSSVRSSSSVGAPTNTKVGTPSAPRRYTPSSTRQCRCMLGLAVEPEDKQSDGLFVPGEGPGHWPGAACKASRSAGSA
jgi:hypothetical protein